MGAKLALLLAAFGALGHAWAQGPCAVRTSPRSARALLGAKTERPVHLPAARFYETLEEAAKLLDPRGGFVLLGIEGRTQGAQFAPIAPIQSDEPLTFGQILSMVLRQAPGEECAIVGPRLVNLYPAGAISDPADILNKILAGFHHSNVNVGTFLISPWFYDNSILPTWGGAVTVLGFGETLARVDSGPATLRALLNQVMVAGAEQQMQGPRKPAIIPGWAWLHLLGAPAGRQLEIDGLNTSPYWPRPPKPPPFGPEQDATACGTACGSISGTVVDLSGAPVAEARVEAVQLGRPTSQMAVSILADSSGKFVYPRLRFGRYQITAAKPASGYPLNGKIVGTSNAPEPTISAADRSAQVAVRLGPKAAVLILQVTDAATGRALPVAGEFSPTVWWGTIGPNAASEGGAPMGPRPSTDFIPSGREVEVSITARGYDSWKGKFKLAPGEEKLVAVRLAKRPAN